jgi:hypothetical protein
LIKQDLTYDDLHPHLEARMRQRGISLEEINLTLGEGWEATDAKPGTFGKVKVFPYNKEWEGQIYKEKEVTVFYKISQSKNIILLTALARYGEQFEWR